MAATRDRDRVRDEVVRLVHRSADVAQLAREVSRVVRRAVPFDGTCLLTMDPATLLPTADVAENALPASATVRLTERSSFANRTSTSSRTWPAGDSLRPGWPRPQQASST